MESIYYCSCLVTEHEKVQYHEPPDWSNIVPNPLHRHLGPSLEHSVPVDIAPTRQCVSIKSFGEPSAGRSENLVERQSSLTRSGMQQSASFHSALVRFPQYAI